MYQRVLTGHDYPMDVFAGMRWHCISEFNSRMYQRVMMGDDDPLDVFNGILLEIQHFLLDNVVQKGLGKAFGSCGDGFYQMTVPC